MAKKGMIPGGPPSVHNAVSGAAYGTTVQAGAIGDVHVHTSRVVPGLTCQRQLPRGVPTPLWADRVSEIDTLTRLAATPGPTVVVLSGIAGAGKTALALRWLTMHAELFPDGQLYADLGDGSPSDTEPLHPADVLQTWLLTWGYDSPPSALAAQQAVFRSLTAQRRLAVLLDNAASETQIQPLLTASEHSITIITSRRAGLAVSAARHLPVAPLNPVDSADLLCTLAGDDCLDPEMARVLAVHCGGLPETITRLAVHLAVNPHLAQHAHRALSAATNTHREVTTMSYDQLSPRGQELLRRIGDLPALEFDLATAAALLDTDRNQARRTVDELVRAALIREQPALIDTDEWDARFAISEPTHQHARSLADTDDDQPSRQAATHRVTSSYQARLVACDVALNRLSLRYNADYQPYLREGRDPGVSPHTALAWVIAERRAVQGLQHRAVACGDDDTAWKLAESIWGAYLKGGGHQSLIDIHTVGIEAARRCAHPVASKLLSQRSWAWCALGDHDGALADAGLARDFAQATEDRYAESTALSALGRAFMASHRYQEAIDAFHESLTIAAAIDHSRGLALRSRHIADCYVALGDDDAARQWYEAAAERARSGKDSENWARTNGRLADVLTRQGHPDQARELLDQALPIMQRSGSHRYVADVHAAYGRAARSLGDLDAARHHYDDATDHYTAAGDLTTAEALRADRDTLVNSQ